MTLDEIMQSKTLSNLGKANEIYYQFMGRGPYTVCDPTDVNWAENGRRFRDLRVAQAYALVTGQGWHVVGPDGICHDAEWSPRAAVCA